MKISLLQETRIVEALIIGVVVAIVSRLTMPGEGPLKLEIGGKANAPLIHALVVGLVAAAMLLLLDYEEEEIEVDISKVTGQAVPLGPEDGGGGGGSGGNGGNGGSCGTCPTGACY